LQRVPAASVAGGAAATGTHPIRAIKCPMVGATPGSVTLLKRKPEGQPLIWTETPTLLGSNIASRLGEPPCDDKKPVSNQKARNIPLRSCLSSNANRTACLTSFRLRVTCPARTAPHVSRGTKVPAATAALGTQPLPSNDFQGPTTPHGCEARFGQNPENPATRAQHPRHCLSNMGRSISL